MSEATEQITLDELLQLAISTHMAEVHVAVPAVVTAYDRAKGTVGVTIPVNSMVPDGSGNYVSDPYPAMSDVPIEWPRCGKFAITFPLVAGDTGMLVCCERNISAWRATGEPGDPGDIGAHVLDGAVFRPGLSPDRAPPGNASASDMVVGSEDDAKGRVAFKAAGLELGQGATKGVILAADKTSADTTMAAWISAAQTLLVALATATGGVAPIAPTDFGKNGSGSSSTKAL